MILHVCFLLLVQLVVAKAAVITHGAFISGVMNTQMAMAAVLKRMALNYGIDVESIKVSDAPKRVAFNISVISYKWLQCSVYDCTNQWWKIGDNG